MTDERDPEPKPRPKRLARVFRLGGYAFWTTAGFMLPLMIDRLIVLPELNNQLGEELFGGLVWAIGALNMFTNAGSAGCAVLLMRQMAAMDRGEAADATRTAWTLSLFLSMSILGIATLACLPFAPKEVTDNAWVMLGPILAYSIISGVSQVLITVMRIRRRFIFTFVIKAIEGAVLLANFLVAPTKLIWLIGTVYVASVLIPMVYGMIATPEFRGASSWFNRQTARWLMTGWIGGALISLSESTQRNIARVLLGVLGDPAKTAEQVAVFYAGTSIGNIFVMPVSRLSMLILALLSGHTAFALKGRKGAQYAVGVALLMLMVGASSYYLGGWLVTNRYPRLADRTLEFYAWIALANAFSSVLLMLRPVAIKYAPLALAAGASVAGAVIQIIALAVFIPMYEAEGAAIGLAVAAAASAVMWVFAYIFVGRKHKDTLDAKPETDQSAGL